MSAQVAVRMTPLRVLREFFRWLFHSIPSVLISALLGAAVGWVTNVYRIAIAGGSTPDAPTFTGVVVAGSNRVNAGLFWGLASTVIFGIVGYRRAVGGKRFWREIRGLPRSVASLFKRDGAAARIHLLWGASGAMFASSLVAPRLRGVLAIGLLAGAPSIVGRAVSSLGMRIWGEIQRRVSPGRAKPMQGITSMTVGILGAGAGLAITYLVVKGSGKLYIAIACAVAAVALGRMHKPSSAAGLLILFASAFVFVELIHAARALADDGGWSECATTLGKAKIGFTDWLSSKCQGQGPVYHAAIPAAAITGGFAPVGLFIGHLSGLGAGGGIGRGGTKVAPQGPQPIIDADGKPLTVNNGEWPDVPKGWVWYGGDKGWVSPEKANEEIAKDIAANIANRAHDTQWAIETAADHSTQMQTRITQLQHEADVEKITHLIRDKMDRDEAYLLSHLDQLPLSQQTHVEELIDKINNSEAPNLGDLNRMQRLKQAVFNIRTGATESEAATADTAAAWAGFGEQAAKNIHAGARAAETIVMLAPLAGAGAAWLGAQSVGGFLMSSGAAIGRLGAFHLGRNVIEGAGVGYSEGGPKQALVGAIKRSLPVNTAITIYKGDNIGQVGISMLEDLGNAMQLHAGAKQISGWVRASESNVAGAAHALEGPPNPKPKTPEDLQVLNDRIKGRNLARDYQKLENQLRASPDDAALADKIRNKVNEINANYQSKIYMKNRPPELQDAFNNNLQKEYSRIDAEFTKRMNDAGLQRGGREFSQWDTWDVRNASSKGVGMDRDLALDERFQNYLKGELGKHAPNSPEAIRIQQKLDYVEKMTELTHVGPDGTVRRISTSTWNEEAQKIYNNTFKDITGHDAEQSLQLVTQSKNPEAFADFPVLKNQPDKFPFNPGHAEQTASVPLHKMNEAMHQMKPGDGLQETSRGLGKDIKTKLEPLLRHQDAPAHIQAAVADQRAFLDKFGNGHYLPSQAQGIAQDRFGTDIRGLAQRTSAMLESAIKNQRSL